MTTPKKPPTKKPTKGKPPRPPWGRTLADVTVKKGDAMNTKQLQATFTVRELGDEPEIVITTPGRDLMRDTISPLGMETAQYLAGPAAVNFAHDHSRLPVARTVALTRSPAGIVAKFRWLEGNPEARSVRAVFEEGALGASVEFVPLAPPEPIKAGGWHFPKTTLTGWALTGNPANLECMRLVKSLGLAPAALGLAAAEPVLVNPDDVASAIRTVVAEEVGRALPATLGLAADPDDDFLIVDDDGIPDGGPAVVLADATSVRAATADALKTAVTAEVRRAVNALRGKIDD